MNEKYIAWLEGYLDGKIAKKHIDKIMQKAGEDSSEVTFIPSYPFYDTTPIPTAADPIWISPYTTCATEFIT